VPTTQKIQAVQDLAERLSRSTIAISTGFQGLNVGQMTELRRKLKEQGIELTVVKNTLASIAADQVGKGGFKELLRGPTSIAFGYADQVAIAKALLDYVRSTRLNLTIQGALLENRILTAEQLGELATLPSREVLAASVVGRLVGPLYSLVSVLTANLNALLWVLQRRSEQISQSNAGS